jgi:lysophospholipase L1-like esterase
MQRSTFFWGTILIILTVAAVAEFMAYVTTGYLVRYNIGFTSLNITESHADYQARYDPRLGWKSNRVDDRGEYLEPARPGGMPSDSPRRQTPACVSAYGDSFIEGFGVKPPQSWSSLLSHLLHCRVANFGVSGYGTDQAFLRFLENRQDQAQVVILGFLSENIIRNVNQLRNLISDATTCHAKPRFFLNDAGRLTLAPLPPFTEQEYDTLRQQPEHVLKHEFFLPGGPSGYRQAGFPYTWGILRALPFVWDNVVLRRGMYYDLYRPDHPSRAVAVTQAILAEFSHEAQQRGQKPLILIIPTHIDLAYARRHGVWIYQPITDFLAARGLNYLDLGPIFLRSAEDAPLESLYAAATNYHLNDQGQALMARAVYDWINRHQVLKRADGT